MSLNAAVNWTKVNHRPIKKESETEFPELEVFGNIPTLRLRRSIPAFEPFFFQNRLQLQSQVIVFRYHFIQVME